MQQSPEILPWRPGLIWINSRKIGQYFGRFAVNCSKTLGQLYDHHSKVESTELADLSRPGLDDLYQWDLNHDLNQLIFCQKFLFLLHIRVR